MYTTIIEVTIHITPDSSISITDIMCTDHFTDILQGRPLTSVSYMIDPIEDTITLCVIRIIDPTGIILEGLTPK